MDNFHQHFDGFFSDQREQQKICLLAEFETRNQNKSQAETRESDAADSSKH